MTFRIKGEMGTDPERDLELKIDRANMHIEILLKRIESYVEDIGFLQAQLDSLRKLNRGRDDL